MLAGWRPDFWSPVDLLNRTEAFVAARRCHRRDPPRRHERGGRRCDPQRRRAAVLAGGACNRSRPSSEVRSIGRVSATRSGSLSIAESGRRPRSSGASLSRASSTRPAGTSSAPPRRGGPASRSGHNDRIAWATVRIDADTQDVLQGRCDRGARDQGIRGRQRTRGAVQPFDRSDGTHGVIVAADFQHRSVFTVRWTGTEPGTTPELASLAIDRARNWTEFREAVARWKTPATRFVYADADGNIGSQDAALIPIRAGGEWTGWRPVDELPHTLNPAGDTITAADASRDQRSPAGAQALFAHLLAVTAARRRRFNIGPARPRPADDDSPLPRRLRRQGLGSFTRDRGAGSIRVAGERSLFGSGDALVRRRIAFRFPFTDAAVQAQSVGRR